jgi:hypothetical protein
VRLAIVTSSREGPSIWETVTLRLGFRSDAGYSVHSMEKFIAGHDPSRHRLVMANVLAQWRSIQMRQQNQGQ